MEQELLILKHVLTLLDQDNANQIAANTIKIFIIVVYYNHHFSETIRSLINQRNYYVGRSCLLMLSKPIKKGKKTSPDDL